VTTRSETSPDVGGANQDDPSSWDPSFRGGVLCLSGGMDSTSLLLHLLAKGVTVRALSYDYGQKHRFELQRVEAQLAYLAECGYRVEHRIVDLAVLGPLFDSALTDPDRPIPEGHYENASMRQTVVPNRNAIFASIAYGYALSTAQKSGDRVALGLGVHAGDHAIYPDCRPEFYAALHRAFEVGNWDADRVRLYLPFLQGDKETILRDAERSIEQLGLDFERVFRNTLTSYDPDPLGRSSGRTGADVERILAFHAIGRPDPVDYVASWPEVLAWALECRREFESERGG